MTKPLKASFDAAMRGVELESLAQLKIIDYAKADRPLRVQMEAAIAPIDAAPESRKAIIGYGRDVIAAVTELYRDVDKLSQKALLEQSAALLPQALEVLHDLDGYLGGVKEVLRRYDEVHIPAAVRKAASSGAPADLKRMRDIDEAREVFLEQASVLEGARCLGTVVAERLELGVEQREILDLIDESTMGEYMRHHPAEKAQKQGRKPKAGPRKR